MDVGSKYTRLTLYLGTESKKQILTLYMVWSNCPDDSIKVKQLYVNVIGHKFINPIDECGVWYPPYINQICDGGGGWTQ